MRLRISCLLPVALTLLFGAARNATAGPPTVVQSNSDCIALLLPDGQSATDPKVTVWTDAAAEEGLHVKTVADSAFIALGAKTSQYAGVIMPDQVHTRAGDDLSLAVHNYVKAGGQLMLVYDAGSLSAQGFYPVPPATSRFSDLAGVNYVLTANYPNLNTVNPVYGLEDTMYSLSIPPGKFLPAVNTGTTPPFTDAATGTPNANLRLYGLADTVGVSGYLYGFLNYPYYFTQGTYAGSLFLVAQDNSVVAGYNKFGSGGTLFVNTSLGYLKGFGTDGVLLHGFLHYFGVGVLKQPYLAAVPNGVGGMVLNWHIDPYVKSNSFTGNTALEDLATEKARGLFNQGPFSMHITSGPDLDTFGDGFGWNLPKNTALQGWVKYWQGLGDAIGTHGGYIHNYWGANASETDQFQLTADGIHTFNDLLVLNKRDVDAATGQPTTEYSSPVGNTPTWAVNWMAQNGYQAYYTTANTGMAPTRTYRNGAPNTKLWSVPITPYGKWAVYDEYAEANIPSSELESWNKALVDFSVLNHTVRMEYTHITGPILYPAAFTALMDRAAAYTQTGNFQWYTMTQIAQFLTGRDNVSWNVSNMSDGSQLYTATHPTNLAGQTWLLLKSNHLRPAIITGTGYVDEDDSNWIVVATGGTSFQFSAPAVTIAAPANITVTTDPGKATAIVTFPAPVAAALKTPVTVKSVPASGTAFPIGTTTVVSTATDANGLTAITTFTVTVTDGEKPQITCAPDVSATAPSNQTSVTLNVTPPSATDNAGKPAIAGVRSDGLALTAPFATGETTINWTATDGAGNKDVCTQMVTVSASSVVIKPITLVFFNDPGKATVDLTTFIVPVITFVAPYMATGVRSDGKGILDPYPVGSTTITWTLNYKGTPYSGTVIIVVKDRDLPVISSVTVDKANIYPPDHALVPVTVSYTATDNVGVAGATLSVTSSEAVTSTTKGDLSPDWQIVDSHHVNLREELLAGSNGRTYTITVTVTDAAGNTASKKVSVVAPKKKPKS